MTSPLEARIAALEAKVREAEDIREINELMRRFHYACTGGFGGFQTHRAQEIGDLMAEDATVYVQVLHATAADGPKGRSAIIKYFQGFSGDAGPLPTVFQTGLDYGVEVKGDTAVQKSNLITAHQAKGGNPGMGFSRYENTYVRTPQGWRIKAINLFAGFRIPITSLTPSEPAKPK